MEPETRRLLLHEYFEKQARITPDAKALSIGAQSISYRELDSRADRIAGGLRAAGIPRGSLVGLHVERSIDWVAGILGILKARSTVVPLPPSHPVEWIREILGFASLAVVLDHEDSPLHPSSPGKRLGMAELESGGEEHGADLMADRDHPAFVLCSSGSTGKPKMIVRSHASFFHRLHWTWRELPFDSGEVGCQKAHLTTTHSIYELFEPLLTGIPAVIVPDRDARNLSVFWRTLRDAKVSRLLMVPSALRATLDMPGFVPPPLEVLTIMGEYLHPDLADRILEAFPEQTKIFSIYGSTEASSTLVCDLRSPREPGADLPLGVPLSPEIHPLVLGPDLEPVDPGEKGRLFMGGPALFSGYLGDTSTTSSVLTEVPGEESIFFDTRDEVRLLPNGQIQFLGRVDDMVKVRGYRVELPDVERAILQHPEVTQATVLATDRLGGGTGLVGFYVPATVPRSDVYGELHDRLPHFMIPSDLVALDSLPLTASSKVDRARLLEDYAGLTRPAENDGTATATEARVMQVWEEILGHSHFRLDDSFFEVGGDSLSVFSLVRVLQHRFGLDQGQLEEDSVYRAPTVEGIAAQLEAVPSGRPPCPAGESPILVTLKQGRKAGLAPLFLISSAGGTLGAYRKLVEALGTPREIIGIRDPFNGGDRDPTEGFDRWVARYVHAISERQPTGPYHIVAYSTAGAFGYEIARRLRTRGEEVPVLALIDPLAMDRSSRWRYGYWALRGTWTRPSFRAVIKLMGWLRLPILRVLQAFPLPPRETKQRFSRDEIQEIAGTARTSKAHLMNFSSLMELNTGLPFALAEEDFAGRSPDEYLTALLDRVSELSPEAVPETIERMVVQYQIQVRTQHGVRLSPYDGPVALWEPASRYNGLLEVLLRPYVPRLSAEVLDLPQPAGRALELSSAFKALGPHFRCMRDDTFVRAVAERLDLLLA
jgi:amino acid adenylation domain-containing protein